jgi:hypothetical protein
MDTKMNIVNEILARAAEEIQAELGLEKDIQTDILISSLKEGHALETAALKEKIGALELEWNLSLGKYDGLLKEYTKLETLHNQTVMASKQTEQNFKDTLAFFQQSLSNANNINMQACTQLSVYKQKVALLEGKLAQAYAVVQQAHAPVQAPVQKVQQVPQVQVHMAAVQSPVSDESFIKAQQELMARVGAMLKAAGQGK